MTQKDLMTPETEKKIEALISQMTLEEKIGQTVLKSPSIVGAFDLSFEDLIAQVTDGVISKDEFQSILSNSERDLHEDEIRAGKIGSVCMADPVNAKYLQKIAVEESRLGIPLLFGNDIIHGCKTIFPIPLAESCSWEPELAKASSAVAAKEALENGVNWVFAPMVDIARDARWGRISEGCGEDTYLGSLFAKAKTEGFQGERAEDLKGNKVAACGKHYIAYGGALAGRDYHTVEMAPQTLMETYLPPFKAMTDAGAMTMMSSFNDLNGVPCSANHYTLTEILRDQLKFNGFVVSDANSVNELVNHGYSKDMKDAVRDGINAGVEMDLGGDIYQQHLKECVDDGSVSVETLDEAVRRILRVKFALGLFENPYKGIKEEAPAIDEKDMQTAREVAKRSIVLTKNTGVLPVKDNVKKIALVGPLADNKEDMLGAWSGLGSSEDAVSVFEGLTANASGIQITCAAGCDIEGREMPDFAQAIACAQESDLVIAVVGESCGMSGEAASRADISLPGYQQELIGKLKETGKPLVVIVMAGRPLAIPKVDEMADAILMAWHLGSQAGNAVADVVLGKYNPSAKLTVSVPYQTGQLPLYYNQPSTGRPPRNFKFTSKYIDAPFEPLYPFGYGLSYTSFEYSDLKTGKTELTGSDMLTVSVTVKNTGKLAGEEVVQVYIQDKVASRVRPVRELKGFKKISLAAGESQTVHIEIKASDLGFYNQAMEYVVEPGEFNVYAGTNSRDCLSTSYQIIE